MTDQSTKRLIYSLFFCLLPLLINNGTLKAATHDDMTGNLQQVSEMIGKIVKNGEGEALGKLKDLGIDWQNSRLVYAVLAVGGALGIGEVLLPLPPQALTLATNGDYWVLQMSKEDFEQLVTKTSDLNELYQELDVDQNGYLSQEEAQNNSGIMNQWQQLDTNQDHQRVYRLVCGDGWDAKPPSSNVAMPIPYIILLTLCGKVVRQ